MIVSQQLGCFKMASLSINSTASSFGYSWKGRFPKFMKNSRESIFLMSYGCFSGSLPFTFITFHSISPKEYGILLYQKRKLHPSWWQSALLELLKMTSLKDNSMTKQISYNLSNNFEILPFAEMSQTLRKYSPLQIQSQNYKSRKQFLKQSAVISTKSTFTPLQWVKNSNGFLL